MAKYLIHAMPARMWYVNKHLIPSMIKQGIEDCDITVHCDENHVGNLESCMQAFESVGTLYGTWHMQDDVCISKNFKEQTEKYDKGIVCGFASKYDRNGLEGVVNVNDMWFSFPCIRIPNYIATECARWFRKYIYGNPVCKEYWVDGVNDDWVFRQYVFQHYSKAKALNLAPNIVDHIDYLIGGSVNSDKKSGAIIRSKYWHDEDVVQQLADKLAN